MDLTCIVGTYGDDWWIDLAQERAIRSAASQGMPVIHVHGNTLAQARNEALSQVETPFVVCCDADDELEPEFAQAMAKGSADIRVPMVRQIRPYRELFLMPQVSGHEHECTKDCLPYGNWIVIGAVASTALLWKVGGWGEYGWSEDWATWLRCYKEGASFEVIPEAVYRAYYRKVGRNTDGAGYENRAYWHQRIGHDIWPDMYPEPEPLQEYDISA